MLQAELEHTRIEYDSLPTIAYREITSVVAKENQCRCTSFDLLSQSSPPTFAIKDFASVIGGTASDSEDWFGNDLMNGLVGDSAYGTNKSKLLFLDDELGIALDNLVAKLVNRILVTVELLNHERLLVSP